MAQNINIDQLDNDVRPQTADPPKHSSTLTSFNATCTGIDETTPGEEEDIDEVVGVTPGDKEVV